MSSNLLSWGWSNAFVLYHNSYNKHALSGKFCAANKRPPCTEADAWWLLLSMGSFHRQLNLVRLCKRCNICHSGNTWHRHFLPRTKSENFTDKRILPLLPKRWRVSNSHDLMVTLGSFAWLVLSWKWRKLQQIYPLVDTMRSLLTHWKTICNVQSAS